MHHKQHKTPPLSRSNLLAVGWGRRVQVWRGALTAKQDSPYMSHQVETGSIRDLRFVPYEDVLGIGHAGGFSTILVPGAGEANNDSWVRGVGVDVLCVLCMFCVLHMQMRPTTTRG